MHLLNPRPLAFVTCVRALGGAPEEPSGHLTVNSTTDAAARPAASLTSILRA
jgi:hypothetical protein